MKHTLPAVFALLATSQASASVSGIVQGNVNVFDNRSSAVVPTGGTTIPARRVVVAIRANLQNQSPGANQVNPTTFAVTDELGHFNAGWTDITTGAFPVTLRFEVMWTSSNAAGGGTTIPAVQFAIARFDGGTPNHAFTRTFNAQPTTPVTLNITAATANDESAAYLTAREFFDRIVNRSANLRNRVPGLVVTTRVTGFNQFFGITPTAHKAFVSDGVPSMTPLVQAHEMGHAITWAALNLATAPINPISDYSMNFVPGWQPDTREFSKAAFQEGLADAWSLVWAFGTNANVVLNQGNQVFNFENATITTNGSVSLRCSTASNAHEFPFCHTAAIMDLLDSDGGRGDGTTLGIFQIIDIFNAFPDNCIANGCRDELGFDALNHQDFLRNAPVALRPRIAAVWAINGISFGN